MLCCPCAPQEEEAAPSDAKAASSDASGVTMEELSDEEAAKLNEAEEDALSHDEL